MTTKPVKKDTENYVDAHFFDLVSKELQRQNSATLDLVVRELQKQNSAIVGQLVNHVNDTGINLREFVQSVQQASTNIIVEQFDKRLSRQESLIEVLAEELGRFPAVPKCIGPKVDFPLQTKARGDRCLDHDNAMQATREYQDLVVQPVVNVPAKLVREGSEVFFQQLGSTLSSFHQNTIADIRKELQDTLSSTATRIPHRSTDAPITLSVDGLYHSAKDAGCATMEVAFMTALGVEGEDADHRRRLSRMTQHRLVEQDYSDESLYKSSGWAQHVARSPWFLNITLGIILLNALYIGFEAEKNDVDIPYDSSWHFIVMDNLFCTYFFAEVLVRFLAFRAPRHCCRDAWFVFDTILMLLMFLETWIIAPFTYALSSRNVKFPVEGFRLFRLLRLARAARLVRSFPELVTMTQGLVQGGRACAASVVMIMFLNYIFAVAIHGAMKNDDAINNQLREMLQMSLSSLGDCMWMLLICGTFNMDGTGTIMNLLLYSGKLNRIVACMLILTFTFITAMVICNMLVGVLCEVVAQVAADERETKESTALEEAMLAHLQQYDDGDGKIDKKELDTILNTRESKLVLEKFNVDRVFLAAMQKMFLRHQTDSIPIRSIMEIMLTCRGNNTATVHTLAASLTYLSLKLSELQAALKPDEEPEDGTRLTQNMTGMYQESIGVSAYL